MLHLDGAALAYRRDEGRVELVQPCSWPPSGAATGAASGAVLGMRLLEPVLPSAPSPEPPGGSRERGFGTLKYERRYIDEIDAVVMRAKHAEQYRIDYNQIRAHEAIARTAPGGASGPANPTIPTFRTTEILPAY